MKTRSASSPDKPAALAQVHRARSRITKGSTRTLNTLTADALDKLKSNAKIRGNVVSVDLEDISSHLNESDERIRGLEEKYERLKKILWEGRYCDYLSKVLGKVKQSTAWQRGAPESCKSHQWNVVKEQLDDSKKLQPARSAAIDKALLGAAEELSFPYAGIRSWIDVYVERCDNEAHHGNLETKIKAGDINGCRGQIWADKEDLRGVTPDDYLKHCLYVLTAIHDYEKDIFLSCPRKGNGIQHHQGYHGQTKRANTNG